MVGSPRGTGGSSLGLTMIGAPGSVVGAPSSGLVASVPRPGLRLGLRAYWSPRSPAQVSRTRAGLVPARPRALHESKSSADQAKVRSILVILFHRSISRTRCRASRARPRRRPECGPLHRSPSRRDARSSRPDLAAIRLVGAVAHQIDAELALGRFDRRIDFARRYVEAFGIELEMWISASIELLHLAALAAAQSCGSSTGPGPAVGRIQLAALLHDTDRLAHLLHADEIAVVAIAVLPIGISNSSSL